MAGTLNFSTSYALGAAYNHSRICLYNVDSNLNYYGLSVDTDKLVYNVNSTKTHSFQHGTVELGKSILMVYILDLICYLVLF